MFQAQRLLYHSTLGSTVIKKKKEREAELDRACPGARGCTGLHSQCDTL